MDSQRRASLGLMGRMCLAGMAAAATMLLASCGGGGSDTPMASPMPPAPPPPVVTRFAVTSLVSDYNGISAAHTDPNLVNAWGIAFNPQGFVWVPAAGTDKSTLYDGNGVPQTLVVGTPPEPTGIVFNSTQDFKVVQNGVTAASPFIFSTESGRIAGWAPSVNRTLALEAYNGSAENKVYKGLAIGSSGGANYLYATDFHNNRIDVFDASFQPVTLAGGFRDSGIPAGYGPFGIQAIGDKLYVTYARHQASGDDDEKGAGFGYVSVYDMAGNLQRHLVSAGALNAPWGLAMAPANFGSFSGKLLVANFGDGKINAYDPNTGDWLGVLTKADGSAIVIDGLWGIAFGNGLNAQPTNTLFFTAGPSDEAHGQYGRLDMAP
ncbi:TIGR03118 family protein [Massilia endophytica]|uniref:TIGR03118 family protein n=1 Tax=Massilia endophytica TaxID=2899220 RepID=UPI001E4FBD76|nr:TIGR03118 family protein [Massilia endophytica]UGQ48841.1 TIGR03118 family protein [Massilia endophytica]